MREHSKLQKAAQEAEISTKKFCVNSNSRVISIAKIVAAHALSDRSRIVQLLFVIIIVQTGSPEFEEKHYAAQENQNHTPGNQSFPPDDFRNRSFGRPALSRIRPKLVRHGCGRGACYRRSRKLVAIYVVVLSFDLLYFLGNRLGLFDVVFMFFFLRHCV